MKRIHFLSAFICALAITGCATEVAQEKIRDKAPPTDETLVLDKPAEPIADAKLANYTFGDSIQVDNMTVIPLREKKKEIQDPAPLVDYITLEEATKKGVIEIKELSNPEVEIVKVYNKGTQPILLVGGDLILGGQQDRVVQEDTVIPPGKTVAVRVFCVEEGRWQGSSKFEAGGKVPHRVREAAMSGEAAQGDVWQNVSSVNGALADSSVSTSIRASVNEAKDEVTPKVQKFIDALKKQEGVVGAVFAIDGKVEAMDVFAHPRLFESSRDSLLCGFVAEALASKNKSMAQPKGSDVAWFVADYEKARMTARESDGKNMVTGSTDKYELKEMRVGGQRAASRPVHGFMSVK